MENPELHISVCQIHLIKEDWAPMRVFAEYVAHEERNYLNKLQGLFQDLMEELCLLRILNV